MQKVGRALAALPAEILERDFSPSAFGSWYLVFRFEGRLFRLVFDGRDSLLVLERATRASYRWEPTALQWIGPAAGSVPTEDLVAAVRREAVRSD